MYSNLIILQIDNYYYMVLVISEFQRVSFICNWSSDDYNRKHIYCTIVVGESLDSFSHLLIKNYIIAVYPM